MNDVRTMGVMSPTAPRMDMDTGMDSMTHMTFYWGKSTWILFQGWPGNNTGMYILALVIVFIFAIIMEWLANSKFAPPE